MKVSIIIAAYNIDQYIERWINSIINQTLKDIEIIVVNDGSKDRTLDIIKDIASKDSRIKIIDKQNQGLIEARKSGMKIANGEYLLFVDGDDWLEIDTLEKLYKNAKSNNSDIVIYNAYNSYDNSKYKLNIFRNMNQKDYIKRLFLGDIYPCIWSKFIKLDYIRSNHIEFVSNISYAEDLATSVSLFMHNPQISYVEDYLYNYYQRECSITKTINNKILEINEAIQFIKKKLEEHNLFDKYKEEFDCMIYEHIFEGNFLTRYYNTDLGEKLYNQYKLYNISINNNKYIKEKISKDSLFLRIRIKLYCKSYKLGKVYDKLRYIVKKG